MISVETFFAFIVGTIAPLVFGNLANSMGAMANPRLYGHITCYAMLIGSLLSNIFYFRAGLKYKEMMEKKSEDA